MKKTLFNYQPMNAHVAALLLRLIFGILFIRHGYVKLAAYDDILPIFGDIIGIGSELSLILVIFAEFGCGILVTIGLFTRLAVIPIFITMTVAYFIAHAADPFDAKTLPLVYWLLSFVIFVLGSGRYSVDRLLLSRKRRVEQATIY